MREKDGGLRRVEGLVSDDLASFGGAGVDGGRWVVRVATVLPTATMPNIDTPEKSRATLRPDASWRENSALNRRITVAVGDYRW
jgi:hypothetical protein